MKRSIALIMILVMMLGMSADAFATTVGETENGASQDVWASYAEGARGKPVISVDISWEQMSFTYRGASEPVWNAENHRYEGETTEGGWVPGNGTITIRNNSAVIVQAEIGYTQESGYDSVDMCFTERVPYIGSADTGDAVDDRGVACGTPCQIAIKTIPVGTLAKETGENTKIGTITIKVQADVDVYTVLDALDQKIAECPVSDTEGLDRGAVCFAPGTDTQKLYALTAAALTAYNDQELTAAEKNVAINKAITAVYGALDLVQ